MFNLRDIIENVLKFYKISHQAIINKLDIKHFLIEEINVKLRSIFINFPRVT